MSEYLINLREFLGSLDWLLNLIAIGAYVFSFSVLVREGWRLRRLRKLKELRPSEGAIGLAIGVGVSVTEDASLYLRRHFGEKPNGDLKVPLLLKYSKMGYFGQKELLDIIREIRNKIRELMSVGGVREVHLFYGGPLSVAAALGGIVDNWVPVKWYAHNKSTGDYEYLFTLDVETIKGL